MHSWIAKAIDGRWYACQWLPEEHRIKVTPLNDDNARLAAALAAQPEQRVRLG